MAVKSVERGKVIKQNVAGTIFDVRQVPKFITAKNTGKRRVETSTYAIFIGKNKVKDGFKGVNDIAGFLAENLHKYDKKARKFK